MIRKLKKHLFLCAGLGVLFIAVAAPVVAAQASGAIAQGFTADNGKGAIVSGAIVSSKADNPRIAELADNQSAARVVGVADSDSLVTISTTSGEVQVVVSGTTSVIVSDLNGPIAAGDKITTSPITGVGMRATEDGQVIGTAQGTFDGTSGQTRTVPTQSGGQRTVHIGRVPLQIGIAFYRTPASEFLPPFVQHLANGIAGKQVSLIRILLAGALILAAIIGVGILVYGSIRSALLSIGRNPLAGGDIRKSLYQVGMAAFALLGGVLLASYLILTL